MAFSDVSATVRLRQYCLDIERAWNNASTIFAATSSKTLSPRPKRLAAYGFNKRMVMIAMFRYGSTKKVSCVMVRLWYD